MNYIESIPKRFSQIKFISDGTTSVVYSAKDEEDNITKIIKISKNFNKFDLSNEINILKRILHIESSYFIKYYGKIIVKNSQTIESIGIITNVIPESITLFDGIDLFQDVPFLLEEIFKQLLKALSLLHSNNIIHRDIKLENVLFSKSTGRITLIDFGTATYLSSEYDQCINIDDNAMGTICNFSPEIAYASIENKDILFLSDIWALGSMMYTILTKDFIINDKKYTNLTDINNFFSSNAYRSIRNQLNNLNMFPSNPKIIQGLKLCLIHSYYERPTSDQILRILQWK